TDSGAGAGNPLPGTLQRSAGGIPLRTLQTGHRPVNHTGPATADAVNAAVAEAAEGALAGVLSYEVDPLVSVDFNHDPHSSCFAAAQTAVTDGGMIRVVSWYDNEWGFSNRMLDTGVRMGRLMHDTAMQMAS
ncbi:MAG: erythrose-4-phosphate dehydrogenase, partial [Lentibacter algarum]